MKNAVSAKPAYKYFSKRNLLGTLLFLIFVGEGTVGLYNGLATPQGFIVLSSLYLTLFWFYESLISRFQLTYIRLVPLTFAIYSVLVTGLLHGELINYTKGEGVITTLIRIQCSLFPIFAYYILNRYTARPTNVPSVKKTGFILFLLFLLLSPTRQFGFANLLVTLREASLISLIFIGLAVAAAAWALRPVKPGGTYHSKAFSIVTWIIFAIACVPNLVALLMLLLLMPVTILWFQRDPNFRHAKA